MNDIGFKIFIVGKIFDDFKKTLWLDEASKLLINKIIFLSEK